MENVQDRIAKRAYELFMARGGQHGYHIADWFQAEKEITVETAKPKKTAAASPKKAAAPATPKSAPAAAPKKKSAAKK
jgi:hypothetical protein